jgi:probable addiction module antidote protein
MNRPRRAKPLRTVPFDAAEHLGDDETQLAYLNAVLAEGDANAMVAALGTVARARGMSRIAKRTGLGRESLYKALSDSGNPAFTTIVGVASALGYTFEIKRLL